MKSCGTAALGCVASAVSLSDLGRTITPNFVWGSAICGCFFGSFAPVAPLAVKAFGFSDHPITRSPDHKITRFFSGFAFPMTAITAITRRKSRAITDALNHCHPDRLRGSGATREEWRDPDTVSFTMLLQGVSTRISTVLNRQGFSSPCLRASLENATGSYGAPSPARVQRRQARQNLAQARSEARLRAEG